MPHYRSVMATTIDCEGCEYDGEQCTSVEGCIAFQNSKHTSEFEGMTISEMEDWLRKQEPFMFKW